VARGRPNCLGLLDDGYVCDEVTAEILRCVSLRVRSEANAEEKASAHFAQDDSLGGGARNSIQGQGERQRTRHRVRARMIPVPDRRGKKIVTGCG
jgi:hypothetical protein